MTVLALRSALVTAELVDIVHRERITCAPRLNHFDTTGEGGFAQKIAIPERNLVIIDDSLTFDQAALVEPIACGWHATCCQAHPAGSDATRALVFGGGAIGMGAALSLRAQGIENVSLVNQTKCAVLLRPATICM